MLEDTSKRVVYVAVSTEMLKEDWSEPVHVRIVLVDGRAELEVRKVPKFQGALYSPQPL